MHSVPRRVDPGALECTGVAWMTPRLDNDDHWEQALPLRAQQRLGLARVLLQRSAWILMQEATDGTVASSQDRAEPTD